MHGRRQAQYSHRRMLERHDGLAELAKGVVQKGRHEIQALFDERLVRRVLRNPPRDTKWAFGSRPGKDKLQRRAVALKSGVCEAHGVRARGVALHDILGRHVCVGLVRSTEDVEAAISLLSTTVAFGANLCVCGEQIVKSSCHWRVVDACVRKLKSPRMNLVQRSSGCSRRASLAN